MEQLYNVWALQKDNNLDYGSGEYRSLVPLPVEEEGPDTDVDGYTWIPIAQNVTGEDAYKVMNQYPQVARPKQW